MTGAGSETELDGTFTVVVHERDRVNSELLADHLDGSPYLEVVGTSVTSEATLDLVNLREPDLVVSHADAPRNGSLRLAQRLRAKNPATPLVVFGVDAGPSTTVEYLEAGAISYVREDDGLEALDSALRDVLSDRSRLDPEVGYRVVRRLAQLAEICRRKGLDAGRLQRLTPREREVLELLGEGLTNAQIADRMYVEVSTVKSHVHSILEKLEVHDREEAARYLLLVDEDGDD